MASTEVWFDVYYQLRVRLGEVTSGHLQHHYAMLKVLSSAFGGEESNKGKLVNDMKPKEAVTQLNDFFKV